MVDDSSMLALKARHVFPVSGAPLDGGVVTIRGDRIVAVGKEAAGGAVRDLGNVAVVPGLVNAHTHLEFSDLAAPLGERGTSLPRWILQVVAKRRSASTSRDKSVAFGLAECLATGTTTLGEIATFDWRTSPGMSEPRPDVVMFREVIAPTRDRIAEALSAAESFAAAKSTSAGIQPSLSPHAPYTVHPELLAALVELSIRARLPLAMHLAETREELELLATRGGEFRTMLKELNAWDPRLAARLPTVRDYLHLLAQAPRALIIHGNYLSADDIAYLAEHGAHMSAVYCPRTHDFFGHETYPLNEMLARGVAVALGTDSRASNPDLSLWSEMRFAAEHHPRVSPADILALGTDRGARALGVDHEVGSLEPGKRANLAVIELSTDSAANPHELLFTPDARVVQTWLGGKQVVEGS